MPTNTERLIDLLTSPVTQKTKGVAAAMRRFNSTLTGRQEAYLKDLEAREPEPRPQQYRHPGHHAHADPNGLDALSAADLAWLERLPSDPAEVRYDDALRLAELSFTLKARTPDQRLVDSIWEPVKAAHDRRAAEADLAAAQQPLPAVDPEAIAIVADSIQIETPQLTQTEARTRASRLLAEHQNRRAADREAAIAAAMNRLAAIAEQTVEREKVTA
jgi:hypothetical protein